MPSFEVVHPCRVPFCKGCLRSTADASTLHHECFKVFVQKSPGWLDQKLEKLAFVTTWKNPFRYAHSLKLHPELDSVQAMDLVAELCELPKPQGVALPRVVVEMIRHLSEDAIFWQYASVLDLVNRVNSMEKMGRLVSHKISHVASWKRGLPPVLTSDSDSSAGSIFRIKVDTYGISSVERFHERPLPSTPRSNSAGYIIQTQDKLRNAALDFQVSLTRKGSISLFDPNIPRLDFVVFAPTHQQT